MKTKQILLPVACVIAAFGLFSCEKEPTIEPTPLVTTTADVSLKDGILVFKDRATMRLYNATLNAKGFTYADEWEKSLHFESMAHILNEVTAAESKLEQDFLLGKSADELKRLPKGPTPHTALYTKWVNLGTLRIQKEADGAEKLGFNASHTHYTNVMNADGLVAFGDTVCQYKGNKIKMTTKGLSNVAVLQAATVSEPAQQVTVVLSPFRYEQVGQQRSTNQLVVNYNDFVDAYNNNHERSTMKVAMYSDLLYDAHKQNYVDFWMEATCEHKNFWGNWVNNDFGDGIWSIEANWSWNAVVNESEMSSLQVNAPGYTRGVQSLNYVPSSHPGYIKLDYTTGAPQFGNQIFPNGTYTPYFNPSINYWISQGIKLDQGSTFKLIPVQWRPEALLTWWKLN